MIKSSLITAAASLMVLSSTVYVAPQGVSADDSQDSVLSKEVTANTYRVVSGDDLRNAQLLQASMATGESLKVGDVNIVPLQVTGPPAERLNLIILGDGYTEEEMDKFREDVDRNQNVQWSVEPFRSYRNYFNVYMVETPSKDSGISCDPNDGNVRRETVFNLQYAGSCPADALARGVTYGAGGAQARNNIITNYVAPLLGISATAQNIQTLALGNTTTYGGIGGGDATTTGGSPQGPLVSLHELGHSLGSLRDEYAYNNRGIPGGAHPDSEPSSFHHTQMTSEEMISSASKWWRWLGEESESGGIIRAADADGHESGSLKSSNVWRPSAHSMMRHTGFYFDQVGKEHMTQRITGMRNASKMPLTSTPVGEIGPEDVVWVETMSPRFHVLDVTWEVNGKEVADTHNSQNLQLADLKVKAGDTVKVTVRDQTDFVRDTSFLDGPRMTQTREWTVGQPLPENEVNVEFTNHSYTGRSLAFNEVAFVQTTNPTNRVLDVTWELNGEVVADTHNNRYLDLGGFDLPEGSSKLSAKVTDPANPDGEADVVSWTVDNVLPTAARTLSESLTTLPGKVEHNVYFDEFDMALEPKDDQPGFVVGELRLNGDGWFNYFGFPDAPKGTPFNFSHSGTDVKELTYGNLGTGGLSKATFEQSYTDGDPGGAFIPGFGTHTVEHRAIDATGNIGNAEEFQATVLPGESLVCTDTVTDKHMGDLVITEGVTCLDSAQIIGDITVSNGASVAVSNSTIEGSLVTDNARAVQVFGSTVNGWSVISGTTTDVTLAGNAFSGGLTLADNTQISTNVQFGDYGPIMAGNIVSGLLASYGNNAEIADFGAPNDVSGIQVGDSSDQGTSAADIETLVEYSAKQGGIVNESTVRALQVHLTAVERFEKQGAGDKVVKHMNGFKVLLDQQLKNNLISVQAHKTLQGSTDYLIKKWR
ncbi:M64 family metallopeptidase [Sporosarcina sp. NPDC096371]|uniref:M64 family metallopeptidase n=1 Tax=Sporosarcina sp. NPDC096371 TaxID=3364530 RepID=UPI0037F7CC01